MGKKPLVEEQMDKSRTTVKRNIYAGVPAFALCGGEYCASHIFMKLSDHTSSMLKLVSLLFLFVNI